MLQRPMVSPRSGRCLIALLLLIKVALLIWNAAAFDGRTYDAGYQSDRAVFGGLRPAKTAHDGPAYYLAALTVARPDDVPRLARETVGEDDEPGPPLAERPPRLSRAEKAFRVELLSRLRHSNVLWLGLFYGLWLFWSFPRLVQGFQAWFLASLLLLAVPAYQRLGAMSHPDNLLVAEVSAAVALWLWLRERWQRKQPLHSWQLALLALTIGLMLWTRWLAIAPAAVLAVVCVVYAVRSVDGKLLALAPRLLLLAVLMSAPGLSWSLMSRAAAHEPGREYVASYVPELGRDRANYDYGRYYASFHARRLLDDERGSSSNSFSTLMYSEIWGDEWLSFANPKSKDAKVVQTRVVLACALIVPLVCIVLAGTMAVALFEAFKRWRVDASADGVGVSSALEPELVLLGLTLLGAGLFVVWQGGPGLLPNDNSSVRFNCIAAELPPAIALLFARPLPPVAFNLLTGYFLTLFTLAFPLAMYWPS